MAVVIALDVGEKRIGVAVSDALGMLARPLTTVAYGKRAEALGEIRRLVEEHGAETVVAGLPKTLRNEIGPQAQRVLGFVEALKPALDVPVEVWDERLTTAEASRILRESSDRPPRAGSSDKRRRQVKEQIDAVAAAVLLESYLSTLGHGD